MFPKCKTYHQTEKTDGRFPDACSRCGKTRKAHEPDESVHLVFQGRYRFYANWEVAKQDGFHPVSIKETDYFYPTRS